MTNSIYVSRRPCFIVSSGRSGSMMLARVLALHTEIASFHEPRPLLNTEAYLRWAGRRDSDWIQQRLRWKRDDLIRQIETNGLGYVESSHFLSHLIPELLQRYDARFVHLYRDGRDFVRSGLERKWYQPQGPLGLLRDALRRSTALDIWNSYRDHRLKPPRGITTRLEAVAWLWAEINSRILQHLEQVPQESRLGIRLESFGPKTLGRLTAFLQLETAPDLIERMSAVATGKPNRTTTRSVNGWEQWEPHQQESFKRVAGRMMERLGYRC